MESRNLRTYLSGMAETARAISWLWREFVDADGRRYFRGIALWMTLAKLVGLGYPWLLGYGITALYDRDREKVITAFVVVIVTLAFRTLFEWLAGRNVELFAGQNIRTLDRRINERFFEKELGLHIEENKLLCQSSMEKGRERADRVNHMVAFMAVDILLTLSITAAVLVAISPFSSLIVVLTMIASASVSAGLNNRVMAGAEAVDKVYRAIIRRRNERWDAVERVKTNGKEAEEIADMDRQFGDMLVDDRRVWLTYIRGTNVRNGINILGFAAMAWYMGSRVWEGTATVPELVSVITWGMLVMEQIRMLARLERDLAWCTPALKSMREALELPKRVFDVTNAVVLDDAPVEVALEGVGHNYKAGNAVLRDVAFTIPRGKSVALIGPSGAGKSTIVRLLQRYMDPTNGRILVNGVDLRQVALASWQRLVAYIPQKPQIMDGTLRDNLLYGLTAEEQKAWNDDRLWAFARRFRVDFGSRLDKGLDTQVGKHGVELSGGEAQRVMIAAAALKAPRFMIIDEATSSLDAESQAAVQDAIYELLGSGASAIIIAHRLSTVSRCDHFVVLQPASAAKQSDIPQVEAVARSQHELWTISPTFKRLASLEGITFAT